MSGDTGRCHPLFSYTKVTLGHVGAMRKTWHLAPVASATDLAEREVARELGAGKSHPGGGCRMDVAFLTWSSCNQPEGVQVKRTNNDKGTESGDREWEQR